MDLGFLAGINVMKVLLAYIVFYYLIAQPFFNLDFFKSTVLFIVLYVLYKKYGGNLSSKLSGFGKRRRH